jgi:hypothetical protein
MQAIAALHRKGDHVVHREVRDEALTGENLEEERRTRDL